MSIAVVIGASRAGMAAVQALSRRFSHVTLVEQRAGLERVAEFRQPPNVRVLDGMEAVFLLPSMTGVGGAAIRPRHATMADVRYLLADLVVCTIADTQLLARWYDGIGWRYQEDRHGHPRTPPGLLLIGGAGGSENRGGIIEPEATFMTV